MDPRHTGQFPNQGEVPATRIFGTQPFPPPPLIASWRKVVRGTAHAGRAGLESSVPEP